MFNRSTMRWMALLASVAFTGTAAAQITTGVVTGTVKDAQGGVVPGVSVTLTNAAQGTNVAQGVTNQDGDFTFPAVPSGTYNLDVMLSGFKQLRRTGIAVSGGDRLVVQSLVLEIGSASEVVNVVAEAPLIQAQSGERSFTVTSDQVSNLPMTGRSFLNLALLAPGIGGVAPSAAGANEQNMTRLGGGGSSNFTIDGVGVMDVGNGNVPLLLNVEAVQEVRVVSSGYQAEYGRSSGMQITAVSKSGTNQFRGSVYTVERNSDWSENSWANLRNGIAKPDVKERDWGYSLGGPIGKPGGANKLFFFGSQEWRPREIGGAIRRFRVPTALERQGNFSQSRNNTGALINRIRDAQSGQACNATTTAGCFQDGNILGKIPQNRLYPIGLNVLNLWPLPNDEAGYAINNSYNYTDVSPTVKSHTRQEAVRGDYQYSSNLRFGGKFVRQDSTRRPNQSGQLFPQGNSLLVGFNDAIETRPQVYQHSLNLNYTLNAVTFLEANFGGLTRYVGTLTVTPNSNRNNVGLANFPMLIPDANLIDPRWDMLSRLQEDDAPWFENGRIYGLPVFSWGNLIANAPPNTRDISPLHAANHLTNFNMSVTRLAGRHTLKAGYFLEHSYKAQSDRGLTGLPAYQGTVNFANDTNNPLDSGFGFSNAALGIVSSYGQRSGVLEGIYVYDNHEFFAQDNWKVTNRLTVDLGLRFVHATPQYDKNGFGANFIPSEWNAAAAPVLYRPICAPGTVAPCTGQNLRAVNPRTGVVLGAGSATLVGQLVPNSGVVPNGVFQAGTGPVAKTVYTLPGLAVAPRFGFAYDVTGRQTLVLRGGAGLFHDRSTGNDVYGMVGNPPTAFGSTVSYVQLADIAAGGLGVQSPARLAAIQYDSPLPASVQWNSGVQMALPWSTALDVAYVGQHGYNLLQPVDVNVPAFGAAYLPANQDPTKSSAVPGAAALATDFFRPFTGFGQIQYLIAANRNTFHSLQTSLNRRFRNGVQFTFNYTLSRNKGTDLNGTPRIDAANGRFSLRSDNDQANYHLTANNRTHVVKANLVWDLPDLRSQPGMAWRVLGGVVNDWQLSSVLTAGSGAPYTVGYTITGVGAVNLTGTPNYNARIVITGDPGSGCSGDLTSQFNTEAFQGPATGSLGLESGLNYMTGCSDRTVDLALARNIRFRGGRTVQIRIEALNAFNTTVINARNATVQYASLGTVTSPINLPYDASGNLIPGRAIPQGAGFGVATGAQAMRSIQGQIRFQF